jgi:hypothetical protein
VRSSAGEALNVSDVRLGDVFVCSGQSNIGSRETAAISAALQLEPPELLKSLTGLPIRVFRVGELDQWASGEPLPELASAPVMPWADGSSAARIAEFSAVCYFMAVDIAAATGGSVPLGLIETAWGGSSIQSWSTRRSISACSAPPVSLWWIPGTDSSLFNAMVAPFMVGPMAVSGLVFYQGETHVIMHQAEYFACALPALMRDWRAGFMGRAAGAGAAAQPPLPWFGVVQLAPWIAEAADAGQLPLVRAAQVAAAASEPKATLACGTDAGDPLSPYGSIHPRRKRILGQRLAAGALHQIYGKAQQPWSGPVYDSSEAVGEAGGSSGSSSLLQVRVRFKAGSIGGGGLQLRPWSAESFSSRCPEEAHVPGWQCEWFSIQASSGAWLNASSVQVEEGGQTLLLSVQAPAAAAGSAPLKPVASRNGWSAWPVVILYDAAGLPALPWEQQLGGPASAPQAASL